MLQICFNPHVPVNTFTLCLIAYIKQKRPNSHNSKKQNQNFVYDFNQKI